MHGLFQGHQLQVPSAMKRAQNRQLPRQGVRPLVGGAFPNEALLGLRALTLLAGYHKQLAIHWE